MMRPGDLGVKTTTKVNFLDELAWRGLLHQRTAEAELDRFPAAAIGELHLAGHSLRRIGDAELRIDDHASSVSEPVWRLFEKAIRLFGPRATLIEWDSALPSLPTLLGEAMLAQERLARGSGGRAP